MSTTLENYISLINAAGRAVAHGELVRITANKTFALAQADTLGNSTAYVGANGSGTIGVGGHANIFTSGASIDVLMVTGLTPTAGQVVYLSDITAGRGVTTAPTISVTVGVIVDASKYASAGFVTVVARGGGGGGGGGSGSLTAGLNINGTLLATNTVATVATDFLQEVHANAVPGANVIYQRSRGTSSVPLVVTAADYVGNDTHQPYTGTQYLNTVRVGTSVTPGATISNTSVPTDWYVDLFATGVSTDPKALAANAYTYPLRIVAGVGTSVAQGDDHYGTILVNGPASMTEAQTVVYAPTHETASLNTFGLAATGHHSYSVAHWRPNSANTWVPNGGFSWAFNGGGSTAGNENTYYEMTGLYAGANEILEYVKAVAGKGVGGRGQIEPTFAYSFSIANAPLITYNTGVGASYDLTVSRDKALPATISYTFGQDALGGNFLRILAGGTGTAGVWVGPSNNTNGWFYDQNVGGLYSQNDFSSTQIGRPGVLATNSTKEFLALSTMAGAPTGQPAFLSAGKTPIVWNSTHRVMHANRPTTTTWDVIPTMALVNNGAVACVMTPNVGPTGANTAIQRWAAFPDGAGGTITVPSWT